MTATSKMDRPKFGKRAKGGQASGSRGPYRRTRELIDHVLRVLDEYGDISMSTRQVYYQMVSCGAVDNNPKEYGRVQRLLVDMRRDGAVPYHRIVDRTRRKHHRQGWDGAVDILNACAVQYRRNYWSAQDTVVMIACEKQALEGVFAEVCDEYGVSLWIVRGYLSLSFGFEWANEIRHLRNSGKRVAISYFGDHDPSGLNIETKCGESLRSHGAEFAWERRGLLWEDLDAYDLVNIPIKKTDTRAPAYFERFGNRAAELDALKPDVLQERIRDAIRAHLDMDSWERVAAAEAAEKESLNLITKNWPLVLDAVGGQP